MKKLLYWYGVYWLCVNINDYANIIHDKIIIPILKNGNAKIEKRREEIERQIANKNSDKSVNGRHIGFERC